MNANDVVDALAVEIMRAMASRRISRASCLSVRGRGEMHASNEALATVARFELEGTLSESFLDAES